MLEDYKFTFHYGPIQMYIQFWNEFWFYSIYIPLWSYSNRVKSLSRLVVRVFTFHYGPIQIKYTFIYCITILIYIPLWSYSNIGQKNNINILIQIYIPLWSYSNIKPLNLYQILLIIYIPLWSYSNINQPYQFEVVSKFTFHYGPIQITTFHTF